MGRAIALVYGIVSYVIFLVVFTAAIWFVWTMDDAAPTPDLSRALLINAALLGLFAVQHSVMARQWFKRAWTKIVPPPVEQHVRAFLQPRPGSARLLLAAADGAGVDG
jgi:protein-S-isoprenylcysteine O-methyltransferase Ste14